LQLGDSQKLEVESKIYAYPPFEVKHIDSSALHRSNKKKRL
jgi:hypothetical protein